MNFSIIRSVAWSLCLITLISCSSDNQKETRSGLKIDLVRKGEGTPAIKGGVAMLNITYQTEDGRMLFSSEEKGGAVPVRMTEEDKGLLDEVVDILNVGDSVVFEIPAEDLYERTYGVSLPDSIDRGTSLIFNLGLDNTMTMTAFEAVEEERQAEQRARYMREAEEQLQKDIAAIDDKLESEGKEYIKLKSGVRVVVNKAGKGQAPDDGDELSVHYEGRFFESGETFDASDRNGDPLEFRLGSGVIEGWTKAFATLKEGAKATLYIPSGLGYGPAQYGPIPANSILVFDVELMNIEKN